MYHFPYIGVYRDIYVQKFTYRCPFITQNCKFCCLSAANVSVSKSLRSLFKAHKFSSTFSRNCNQTTFMRGKKRSVIHVEAKTTLIKQGLTLRPTEQIRNISRRYQGPTSAINDASVLTCAVFEVLLCCKIVASWSDGGL